MKKDCADEGGDRNCAVLPTPVETQSLSAVAGHGGTAVQEHAFCVWYSGLWELDKGHGERWSGHFFGWV